MGILDAIQGTKVYLDTNTWIYALEGHPAFAQDLTQLFQSIDQGNLSVVTSELSLAEVLVKPFQNHDLAQQTTYQQLISNSQNLTVIPVSRQVLIEAAQLRASINIKLPKRGKGERGRGKGKKRVKLFPTRYKAPIFKYGEY